MKTIDYKEYFHAAYKGADDFNTNILEPLLGENLLKLATTTNYVGKYDKTIIQSIHQYGKYALEDYAEPVGFFDVTLTDGCHLERNKQSIKKTVIGLMQKFSGAFIVFHYDDNNPNHTWRLSWVEKLSGNSKTSAPKRYTYLCGPDYSCRTIGERFETLAKDKNRTLSAITTAFDVETLSDDFFKEYKVFYEDIVQYICGQRFVPKEGKTKEFESRPIEKPDIISRRGVFNQFQENFPGKDVYGNSLAEKAVRDYVKKLLGRLVFIQFLQKKGWLGIPSSKKDWEGGDTDFLSNTFSNAPSDSKDNFVENVLEDILFDSFNKPNSIRNGIKYPYLNGGLFERDKADELKVKLPRALFVSENDNERKYLGKPADGDEYDYTQAEGLFQFFDRYNFTIDENDPDDAIVGVDPEMLGKIFENLLEDNKDKGAFYTTKEIVQYMCREALISYLCTEIKGIDDAIRRLVEGHIEDNLKEKENKKLYDAIQTNKDSVLETVKNVKICDPAIGSGAFPMGLLNLLLHIRLALGETDRCQIKKDIILNNIYGVDIEQGAIDIARLRFWLAIMVDETEPSPLPNFDYKFMQGNSLLENYEGIDLSNLSNANKKKNPSSQQMALVFDEKGALENIHSYLKSYFDLQGDDKKKRKDQINDEVKKYIECVTEGQNKNKQAEMLAIDFAANDKFFLWNLWFADVFSRPDKKGFDIVIGNPPYVEAKKLKSQSANLKKVFKETYTGTADLSIYFIALAIRLIREQGQLCYITTNKFFNTQYGKPVRQLLLKNTITHLINFEQVEVFKDILVSSVIIGIVRDKVVRKDYAFAYQQFFKLKFQQFKQEFAEKQKAFGKFFQSNLDETEWSFATGDSVKLKRKLETFTCLGKIKGINIYRGVTTGYNPAFIITDEQRDSLIAQDVTNRRYIKNMLQGRNIRKWYYNESDENLLFIPWHFPLHNQDISGASEAAEKALEQKHPSIYKWLLSHKEELLKRNQEETGIRYEWYALQRCAASYYQEFERKEKIIWGLTADKWAYTLDSEQHYLPSNGYILTSDSLPIRYVLGILNSKVLRHFFTYIGVFTAGGAYTLKAATISALPIPDTTHEQQQPIIDLVEKVLNIKKQDPQADSSVEERKIDILVYHLYDLTYDEVKIVDKELTNPKNPNYLSEEDYKKMKI